MVEVGAVVVMEVKAVMGVKAVVEMKAVVEVEVEVWVEELQVKIEEEVVAVGMSMEGWEPEVARRVEVELMEELAEMSSLKAGGGN